ncbi:chemotaxis protein CheW [Vulgatibacter sp.]|uniref:chemotaxis protein CheW n=1 Tax=Vulgatibacter sp. TaxID=1971226 RepID=UPI003566A0CD
MRSDETRPEPADPWGVHGTDPWYFCVRLLGARYAFAASLATEVVRLGPMTRLPGAPSFLCGVFQHRGEVLPVFDVAQLLGERPTPLASGGRVALVQSGPYRLALVAEAVEGLVQIADAQLEPAPQGSGGLLEFVERVGADAKGPVALLDLERLIESARERSAAA